MNTCYRMHKSESLLLFLAFLVLIFEAFSFPVDQNEPSEPLSRIVFVNDLPAGETVTLDFPLGTMVYVSCSDEEGAELYEENIRFHTPDMERKMTEAGRIFNSDTFIKEPVFSAQFEKISITNRNNEQAQFANPGIIYFVSADETHLSTVYESRPDHQTIYIQSDHIDYRYITLLNPTGNVQIYDVRHIDGLTILSVTAGGVDEADDMNYLIHNIGKNGVLSKAPIIISEPVITFHKQFSLFPSDFEFTAKALPVQDPSEQVVVPMEWKDWSVAMSPNYMLREQSASFKYLFNTSSEHSQFDLQMFGELDANSSLTISYDGIKGAETEILSRRTLERLTKSSVAKSLLVEYHRGEEDTTMGVLVRVQVSQPASLMLIYISFSAAALRYLFL